MQTFRLGGDNKDVYSIIVSGDFHRLCPPVTLREEHWLELAEFAVRTQSVQHVEFLCNHMPDELVHSTRIFEFGVHVMATMSPACLRTLQTRMGAHPLHRAEQNSWKLELVECMAWVRCERQLAFVLECLGRIEPPVTESELNALFASACQNHAWRVVLGLAGWAVTRDPPLSIRLSDTLRDALEEGYETAVYMVWPLFERGVYERGMETAGARAVVYDDLFATACQDGRGAMARWMVATGNVSPASNDYECFVRACWHDGVLRSVQDVAVWLLRTWPPSSTARRRAFDETYSDEVKAWLAGEVGGFALTAERDPEYYDMYVDRLMLQWYRLVRIKIWLSKCLKTKRHVWYTPGGVLARRIIQRLQQRAKTEFMFTSTRVPRATPYTTQ